MSDFLSKYSSKDKIIIKCEGSTSLPIDALNEFQGSIKKLPKKNRDKLAISIIKNGFIAPLFVWNNKGDWSLLDGHQRLATLIWLRQKGWNIPDLPVAVIKADNEDDAKVKLLHITSQYGEFNVDDLTEFIESIDLNYDDAFRFTDSEIELNLINREDDCSENEIKEDEAVENMINNAWYGYVNEYKDQYDLLNGFMGITENLALIKFLRAKHYKEDYPRYLSLAFHNQQFKTSGDSFSSYNGLEKIINNEIKIERLRFVTGDNLSNLSKGSLSFSGAKMPLDFPVSLAIQLIEEFSKKGNVLDPCHGWGGRLVGAMICDIDEYYGIDASPLQNDGVKKIYNKFNDFSDIKKVTLINSPFENVELNNNYFDFALTSPPYFDREKYIGGKQCHENYDNYNYWRDGFYKTLIEKVYKSLKNGACFALQVGSQKYPLLDDGMKIGKEIGFDVFDIRNTDMKNNFNKTNDRDGEVILLLIKNGKM